MAERIEQYLDEVGAHVRWKRVRPALTQELRTHLELSLIHIWHMVVAQAGAVAARALARRREDVQQLVIQHGVEKFAGLGRQLLIEVLALRQDLSLSLIHI